EVTWINAVNCSTSDNTVQKTSGEDNVEDSGAMTLESIESGDGFIEFVASDKVTVRTCGFLSNTTAPPKTSGFAYSSELLNNKKAYACVNGVRQVKTKYKAKNTFRLAIEGDVVKFYKNGEVFYTSGVAPSYPAIGGASLLTTSASVTGAKIAGGKKIPRVSV